MIFGNWGATEEEINHPVVGDELCPSATLIATRSISIPAPCHEVFPWIRQMGFRRAGWYSYDWIDNLGRKSATRIHPEWQEVTSGDEIPAGPIAFTARLVNEPHSYVLEVKSSRLHFTLAYDLRETEFGTRLVTRMRAHIAAPGGQLIERLILGPGDGMMLRRQLLNLQKLVSGSPHMS